MTDSWRDWVLGQMHRHGWTSQADVVRSSTLTRSAISQWLDPDRQQSPSVENCRKAAEAFDAPILEVFIAAGFLTAEEAEARPLIGTTLDDATAEELARELLRRLTPEDTRTGTSQLRVPGVELPTSSLSSPRN